MVEGKSIEMYLYLLERTDTAYGDEWSKCVVAASSEKRAREIANEEAKADGYVWTDGALASARRIGVAEEDVQGVVIHEVE